MLPTLTGDIFFFGKRGFGLEAFCKGGSPFDVIPGASDVAPP